MSRGRRPVLARQSTGLASAGRRLSSYRGVRRADAPVRRRSRRDGCHRAIRRPAPRERLPLIHGSDARAPPALPPRRGRPGDLGHAARKRTTRLSTPGPAQEARQQAGVRSMLAVWAKAVGRSPQAATLAGLRDPLAQVRRLHVLRVDGERVGDGALGLGQITRIERPLCAGKMADQLPKRCMGRGHRVGTPASSSAARSVPASSRRARPGRAMGAADAVIIRGCR